MRSSATKLIARPLAKAAIPCVAGGERSPHAAGPANLVRSLYPASIDQLDPGEALPTQRVLIENSPMAAYHMITREVFLSMLSYSAQGIVEAEKEFNRESIELNRFESEMLDQYNEVCSAFNSLCVRKLVQRKQSVYNLMMRIYGVFEKYGIESNHRDEFVLEFLKNNVAQKQTYLKIGSGKFRGLFWYGPYTLRFNLAKDNDCSGDGLSKRLVHMRVRLVNGELSAFEKEFKLFFLSTSNKTTQEN